MKKILSSGTFLWVLAIGIFLLYCVENTLPIDTIRVKVDELENWPIGEENLFQYSCSLSF